MKEKKQTKNSVLECHINIWKSRTGQKKSGVGGSPCKTCIQKVETNNNLDANEQIGKIFFDSSDFQANLNHCNNFVRTNFSLVV